MSSASCDGDDDGTYGGPVSAAEKIGRLADRLYNGFLADDAAIQAASNPEAARLVPPR
jgi:hypothetical protein